MTTRRSAVSEPAAIPLLRIENAHFNRCAMRRHDHDTGGALLAGVFVVAARWRAPGSAMVAARYRYVKPSRKRGEKRLARCAHNAHACIRPNVMRNTPRFTITNVVGLRKRYCIGLSRRTGPSFASAWNRLEVCRSSWCVTSTSICVVGFSSMGLSGYSVRIADSSDSWR